MGIELDLQRQIIDPLSQKRAIKMKDWGYIFVESFTEKSGMNPDTGFVLTIPAHSVITFVDIKDPKIEESKLLSLFKEQKVEVFVLNDKNLPDREALIKNNGDILVSNGELFAKVHVFNILTDLEQVQILGLVFMGGIKKQFRSFDRGFMKLSQ